MSEQQSLADLARALTDLGLVHAEGSPRPDYLEMWLDGLAVSDPDSRDTSFIMYRATDGHIGVDGPLLPKTWPIIDAIKSWQAPPPVAPDGFSPDVNRALLEYEGCAMSYGTILDGLSENDPGSLARHEKLLAARAHIAKLIDEIKTPPVVPDGFAQAVERYGDATETLARQFSNPNGLDQRYVDEAESAKAALLAYAPVGGVTITEETTMTMTVTLNRERRTVDQPRYRRDDFLAMFQDISLKAFDLWRTVPGALDEKVEGEWVEVFPGAHFFTAPRYINASAARRNGGGMSNEEIKQAAERVVLLERRIICLAEMLKGADGATAYDVGQWGIGLTVMDIEALIASANAAKASLLAYAPAGGVTITEAMVQDGAEALREWWGNDHYTDEYWTDQARVVLKAAFAEGDADAK